MAPSLAIVLVCECKERIIYNPFDETVVDCQKCGRRWLPVPDLYSYEPDGRLIKARREPCLTKSTL